MNQIHNLVVIICSFNEPLIKQFNSLFSPKRTIIITNSTLSSSKIFQKMFNHHHARSHTPPTTSHLLSSSPPLPSSSSSCSLQPLIHHHVTPSSTTPLNSSSPPIPFPSSSFSPFDRNCDSALNQQHLMHHHQQILLVDVGGQVFKTTRETLCKYEGYFTAYFRFLDHQNVEHGIMNHEKQSLENSTNHGNHAHSNHHYIFLDRNPEMFKIILSCLRVDRTQIEDCLPMGK